MLQATAQNPSAQTGTGPAPLTNNKPAMVIVTTIFFMWGFLTALNDVIIPHLKSIFDLNYKEALLVQFCFFTAFFVVSWPFGKLLERIGYKATMVVGLVTVGVGALLFIPAAKTASFAFFLAADAVLAIGITGLQVSANPYVSILGAPQSSSSRLNLAQAFNSLGTTIAPKLGVYILSSTVLTTAQLAALTAVARHAYRAQEASSVIVPYLILGAVLFLLAIGIALAKLPQIEAALPQHNAHGEVATDQHESIWKYRHTVLGGLAIFVYVGAEVSIGSFLINYFSQHDTGNYTQTAASGLVPWYWGGAMVGRFVGSLFVLRRVSPGKVLGFNAIVAAVLVLASMLTFGHVAVVTILAVGFFNSIMFPTIFTLGIAELGPMTGAGSSLLIASIIGGAIIPEAQGVIADKFGVHHAFILPILCYAYLAYYGFAGSIPVIRRIVSPGQSNDDGSLVGAIS